MILSSAQPFPMSALGKGCSLLQAVVSILLTAVPTDYISHSTLTPMPVIHDSSLDTPDQMYFHMENSGFAQILSIC
jgi:hypothetical protein